MTSKLTDLKKLVPVNFKPLSPLETKLLEGCVEGRLISADDNEKTKLKKNVIRGDFLSWLLGNKDANKFINHLGINIENAFVDGEVILDGARLEFPLRVRKSIFTRQINLNGAHIVNLDLSGSKLEEGLSADFIQTQGSIFLKDGFNSKQPISLVGAEVFGNLICESCELFLEKDIGEWIFRASLSNIRGLVSFKNSRFKGGTVSFVDATIRGTFDCDGANFENRHLIEENKEQISLNLERAKIGGSAFFRNGFEAVGTVRFHESIIGGSLDCEGGCFNAIQSQAINADGLTTVGPVLLRNGFTAKGCVHLYGAKIGNDFDCSRASAVPTIKLGQKKV